MSPVASTAPRPRGLAADALALPNLLTMGRIVAIPLVLWLLDRATPEDCVYAALVYGGAAITDLLDGILARRMGIVSVLGKFLDPLADKLLVMATLVWLVSMGRIPAWAVVLLLTRELCITGLRSIAVTEGIIIAAGDSGKSKTAFQMVGILCLIIGYPYQIGFFPFDFGVVDLVVAGRALVYISLGFSLVSAASYIYGFSEALRAKGRA